MKRLALSFVGVVGALLGAGCPAALAEGSGSSAPAHRTFEARLPPSDEVASQSLNWSGFAAFGSTFTNATGTWTQPAASCASQGKNKTTLAAFWVGMDGFESNTVEQTGTEADCAGATPVYYAWYELYPERFFVIEHRVAPGEEFRAEITQGTLLLEDLSAGWSASENFLPQGLAFNSAEWIAEAPARGRLTEFGSVRFHDASASNAAVGGGAIASSAWSDTPITLVNHGGRQATPLAAPGPLEDGGTAFTLRTTNSQ